MKRGTRVKLLVLGLLIVAGIVVVTRSTNECGDTCTVAGIDVPTVVEDVDAPAGLALIQANEGNPDFVILDVRTPAEFQEEHIRGAVNIDYYAEDFKDQIFDLDRGKAYLLYCRTGRRSGLALPVFQDLAFARIYHLAGGITDWKAQGFPTTATEQQP